MLALIGLDAAPAVLLDELESEGLVPRLTELRQAASTLELTTPASFFPAGAFPTLWSGVPLGEHGIHYPFMWDAPAQRVRYVDAFPSPAMLWDRVSRAGGKVLVVDAYEAPPPGSADGLVISGWQFANRVVLRPRSAPQGARRAWERRLGRAPRAEEVFGEPDERSLRRLAATLVAGPRRVADLVVSALPEIRPDVLVVGLPAVHLAGHQFWDPASVVERISSSSARELQAVLRTVVVEADAAIGTIVEALPGGSDIVVFSSLGMGAETSRTDVLGTMLSAVLYGTAVDGGPASGSWRLRAAVPTSLRARVASALPDAVATSLAARLELRGVDWSRTRAFSVPSDTNGTIRLNVRGRERDGIVDPGDIPSLVAEIRSGLGSFTLDGEERAVASVDLVADSFGGVSASGLLPDLVVRWSERPARRGEVLHSPQFGSIRRHGVGSGRSGNHTDEAWALVLPASGGALHEGRRDLCDVAATALARFGLDSAGRTLIGQA